MTSEEDIYRELQIHLDKLAVGFPETDSGVEIRVLKHLFIPIEAGIASKLGQVPETVNRIYRRVKKIVKSKEELKKHLESMDKNGAIFGKKKGRKAYYRNQILAVGMYEYQINRVTKEFMEDMVQYLDESFGSELTSTNVYQSRIIPVEKILLHNNQIYSFDDVRYLIKKSKKIAVADCICRIGYDRMGKKCKQTELRESCLIFGGPANYYSNHGFGRRITKDEALVIIKKAEEEGLVLQVGNSRKMSFICTCCQCCCGALISAKRLPKSAEFYKNNYFAEINPELCSGCETCVSRCQMSAIEAHNSQMIIDYDNCIGCGLCITTCPENAIVLKKNNVKYRPAKNPYWLFLKILKRKRGRWAVFNVILEFIFKTRLLYILRRG